MPLLLADADVRASVTMADAIDAMEDGFREEGEGEVILPARINMKSGSGWLRVGPVSLERSGWSGFKAMNKADGQGVRYQIHLYRVETGELLAIMDAHYITTLRTGATSAVATRRLARKGPSVIGIIGSGHEARAQLEAMQQLSIVKSARVFSPTQAKRERFALDFQTAHGMEIRSVGSAKESVAGADIVIAAANSTNPVILGEWLSPGMHVCSVGAARRVLREIDPVCFQRSNIIVVDTRHGVFEEAGDAVDAKDAVPMSNVYELSQLVAGRVPGRKDNKQITLFKSVGTGIQDIALAAKVYRRAMELGRGQRWDGFPVLKS